MVILCSGWPENPMKDCWSYFQCLQLRFSPSQMWFCAMIMLHQWDANVNATVMRVSFRENDFKVDDFSKYNLLAKILLKNYRTHFSH